MTAFRINSPASTGYGSVSIATPLNVLSFEMQDTNEKLRLTCGSLQRIATDHVRVPSPMIGQYTLDLRVNSIRDTGTI